MSTVKVDDKVFRALKKKLGKLADKTVKVGVISTKGGGEIRDGISMGELAAIHEFGAPNAGIPERPFVRSTFRDREVIREQTRISAKLAKSIINKQRGINDALAILGSWGEAQVKKKITGENIPPPLKPATIAAKGSTKPLVDTGRLLTAITYEVE